MQRLMQKSQPCLKSKSSCETHGWQCRHRHSTRRPHYSSTFTLNDLLAILNDIHIDQANIDSLIVERQGTQLFKATSIIIGRNADGSNQIELSSLGNSHLSAKLARNPWALQWNLDVPDLKQITPLLTGTILSHGNISNNENYPIANASVTASNIGNQTYRIEKLVGTLNNSISQPTNLEADFKLSAIHLQKYLLKLLILVFVPSDLTKH